jgi:hypothetical protein
MTRNVTRGGDYTRVTTLGSDDVILTWPASGDRAKGITKENLEKQFESDGAISIIKETNVSYTALATDDYIVGLTSLITLSAADVSIMVRPIWFVNASGGNITLEGVPGAPVALSDTAVKGFLPTSIGLIEI